MLQVALVCDGNSLPFAPRFWPGGTNPPAAMLFFVEPLAMPHASSTGALPGARHGFVLVQSHGEFAGASRLYVRNFFSMIVGAM